MKVFCNNSKFMLKRFTKEKLKKVEKEKTKDGLEIRNIFYGTTSSKNSWPNQEKIQDWKLSSKHSKQFSSGSNISLFKVSHLKINDLFKSKTSLNFFNTKDNMNLNISSTEGSHSKKNFDQEMKELIQKKRGMMTKNLSSQIDKSKDLGY